MRTNNYFLSFSNSELKDEYVWALQHGDDALALELLAEINRRAN
jgi:hypothetical protein